MSSDKRKDYKREREKYFKKIKYKRYKFDKFDYSILQKIPYVIRKGNGKSDTFNDCIIMLDTETSKTNEFVETSQKGTQAHRNIVVMFTLSIRVFNKNIVTLWGHKPSECVQMLEKIIENMPGEKTCIYIHNLPYDWTFLRKFIMVKMGTPTKQLNIKSHYPIYIEFANGMILRDSLILAQRKLEKWAIDLNVEHKKAVGFWDYDKIRNQDNEYTKEELTYAEFDTLAGVECLQKLKDMLHKQIYAMPWTATGIPREECRKRGKQENARELFLKIAPQDIELYTELEYAYHGGYTHANRYFVDTVISQKTIEAYDFTSSYPYCLLAFKYPMEKFTRLKSGLKISDILYSMDNYAYVFKFECIGLELKNLHECMPYFQFSKCTKIKNEILDNGRILQCDYAEIYLTEQDLYILNNQYKFKMYKISDCYCAKKSYLPRWLTDYVYELFKDKTNEKNSDPILYNILKAKLNSIYGILVMKWIKETIYEDYKTGEFIKDNNIDSLELFNKFIDTKNNVFPYQWGVYCTAYAVKNLFELGSFCDIWLYSDTDSCYGIGWDKEKIDKYNKKCINNLVKRGYPPIEKDGKIYALGVAELDGVYTEFKTLGAKRYCVRKKDTNELKITVAGVPKKGVGSLNNDINNFKKGTIFSGKISGKLQHTYLYTDNIYIDKNGNEVGDSIDLSQCDYLLDTIERNLLETFDSDIDFINNNMIGEYEE